LLTPAPEQSSVRGTAQGRAASHPDRAFGAESRRAKIPSPRPPSFLPAYLNARFAGEAAAFWKGEKRKMRLPQPSRVRAFGFLLPKNIVFQFGILHYGIYHININCANYG